MAALALALAGLPAAAHAAEAHTVVEGAKRWVVVEAAPGEVNRLVVEVSSDSRAVRLSDAGVPIAPGSGCQPDDSARVVCQLDDRIRLVQVALGDGADRADVVTSGLLAAQVNVKGDAGDDVVRGRGRSRFNFSGNAGDDILQGGEGPDILRGQDGDDFTVGRGGDDLLIGDVGDDVLRAAGGRDRLFGGLGSDKLDARDTPARADAVVACGPGQRDLSTLDRSDRPKTTQCERLRFAPST